MIAKMIPTIDDLPNQWNSKKLCVEGENFLPRAPVDSSISVKVQDELEFIISHFSEPLFPRNVSSAKTENKQKPVGDITSAMDCFQKGSWLDAKIAAFSIGQTNPDLIFIDLDDKDFCSPRACKVALTKILNRIKKKLGGYPTVYRSGRGFHIIQPICCPVNLDNVKKFAALTDKPNNKFLQFAKGYLSDGKADSSNNPAITSCMLRIPGSLNSKNKAEVKIIHRWDGRRPDYRLLIGQFYAHLRGKYEKERSRYQDNAATTRNYVPGVDHGPIGWIEKLLQTPIDDYRYHSRNLILVPYLVLRRGITDVDKVTEIVMKWADKCAELRRLDPSRREYEKRIRSRTYEVMRDRILPMRFETLKEKNPGLYETLKLGTLR